MSTRSFLVPEPLARYIDRTWIDEPDVLRELREETMRSTPDPNMQISSDLGQFFTVLIKGMAVRQALEVGVFTGYSSTVVALALPEDGKLVACDVSEEFTNVARRYWAKAGVAAKVDLHLGPAIESLDSLIAQGMQNRFDFAFIDADKPNYWNYFDRCLRLVRPGGIVCADNVLWSGRVADESNQEDGTNAIREFNRRVHEDPRVIASVVPIGDGLTIVFKKT